ncbi:MAG TPA: hypothetical protein VIY48_11765 [Candidatus Paceibacterota bacterium]
MAKPHDPERQKLIDEQADTIADLLGVDPESIMTDGNYGVSLTPDQMDKLLTTLFANGHQKGYERAISVLKNTAEEANTEGPHRNLDRWAICHAGASILESQV